MRQTARRLRQQVRKRVRRHADPAVDADGPSLMEAFEPRRCSTGGTIDQTPFDPSGSVTLDRQILDGAFGHGYLITWGSQRPLPGLLSQWKRDEVGPLLVQSSPRTVVTVERRAGRLVIIIGHPIDVDGDTVDPHRVARSVLHHLRSRSHDDAVRRAAGVAGRWTMVLLTQADGEPANQFDITVLPDAMATQPIFYSTASGTLALASSEVLVGLSRGLGVNSDAAKLLAAARVRRQTGTIYLPGRISHVLGVEQVAPNCMLHGSLSPTTRLAHVRFWPWRDREENADLAHVRDEFSERLTRHIALISRLGPLTWSLTGGLDSRVLLAHAPDPFPPRSMAFTYFNPRDGARDSGAARDVFVANLLAYRTGLPHRVLRWRTADPDSAFARFHRATHPFGPISQGAAFAMWADLPHDIIQVQGNGGEVGTAFGTRTPSAWSAAKAAGMWMGRQFEQDAQLAEVFEDYLDYTHLETGLSYGYDHHDLFYWEHRMGRWGWRKFLDGDFSHRVVPPFNDRSLLELMLALPEPKRVQKSLYEEVLHRQPLLDVN